MNTEQTSGADYSVFDEMAQYKPLPYASQGQRFANYLIDLVFFYLLLVLFGLFLALLQAITGSEVLYELIMEESDSVLLNYLVTIITWLIAYTGMEGITRGRSLGKLITRTKAVNEDGSRISFGTAFKRSLCRLIPFEPFSALGGTPWHDRITKTTVIKL
jgi:uncharacterized RDD family membrane protein YckC